MKRIICILLVVFCLCFSMALAAIPDKPSAKEWYDKGNYYTSTQDYEKAIEAYTKALNIDLSSPHFLVQFDSQ